MAIRYSSEAMKPRPMPWQGPIPKLAEWRFCDPGYTIGIEGLDEDEAQALLLQLFQHQTQGSLFIGINGLRAC